MHGNVWECRYGDPDSVRTIVRAGHVDLRGTVLTVRGALDIMDCALESEAPDAVIINIWQFLKDSGADRVRPALPPFPLAPEPMSVRQGTHTRTHAHTHLASQGKLAIRRYHTGLHQHIWEHL
jgi:hypothetical protein